jgi:hypothetical protein
MKLGIAIPVLNEEDNIESIIQRSLAARQSIVTTPRIPRCVEYVLGLVRERVLYWQQLRKPA